MADVSIKTVTKVLVDAGETCLAPNDELVRGVVSERLQIDEIWSFRSAQAKNVAPPIAVPASAGDVRTWTRHEADGQLLRGRSVWRGRHDHR
jgi:hypothetical protein